MMVLMIIGAITKWVAQARENVKRFLPDGIVLHRDFI
jgi:hypothetical protein